MRIHLSLPVHVTVSAKWDNIVLGEQMHHFSQSPLALRTPSPNQADEFCLAPSNRCEFILLLYFFFCCELHSFCYVTIATLGKTHFLKLCPSIQLLVHSSSYYKVSGAKYGHGCLPLLVGCNNNNTFQVTRWK